LVVSPLYKLLADILVVIVRAAAIIARTNCNRNDHHDHDGKADNCATHFATLINLSLVMFVLGII